MKDLKDYLGKKKKDDSDPLKKEAKLGVLKDLRGMASGMMKDGMKATVLAKDKKGLEEGLEKVKEIVEDSGEEEREEMESASIEAAEEKSGIDLDQDSEEGESIEHKAKMMASSCESPEELDAAIRILEEKKRQLK